jgi:hypothetical protein
VTLQESASLAAAHVLEEAVRQDLLTIGAAAVQDGLNTSVPPRSAVTT